MPRKIGTPHKIDISGNVYGRWTVLNRGKGAFWVCICSCGTQKIVAGSGLKLGKSVSCGCFKKELDTKHGMEGTDIYNVWAGMKQRCYNPKTKHYPRYGARGITVSNDWQEFKKFYSDMGDKPKSLTLDRVDNDKGYSKENCRWASPKQQSRNRSLTQKYEGIPVAELAEKHGIPLKRLLDRIRRGCPVELLFSVNRNPRNSTLLKQGN